MKLLRACLIGVLFALGCGPNEYTRPPLEPEGVASPPVSAAPDDASACLQAGAEIVPAADGAPEPPCCPGLARVDAYKGSILRLDTCEPEDTGHAFCIRCGDGVCGVGENTCSCLADCQWP